jgi:hypothetical protein
MLLISIIYILHCIYKATSYSCTRFLLVLFVILVYVHLMETIPSCDTGRWLDRNEIKIMPHPPGSPDLNPIEPLWHTLKDLIRNRTHIPTTLDELKIAANEAWDQITEADIDKHVNSMEKRVRAVIEAKGSHTCY